MGDPTWEEGQVTPQVLSWGNCQQKIQKHRKSWRATLQLAPDKWTSAREKLPDVVDFSPAFFTQLAEDQALWCANGEEIYSGASLCIPLQTVGERRCWAFTFFRRDDSLSFWRILDPHATRVCTARARRGHIAPCNTRRAALMVTLE